MKKDILSGHEHINISACRLYVYIYIYINVLVRVCVCVVCIYFHNMIKIKLIVQKYYGFFFNLLQVMSYSFQLIELTFN